MRLHNLTLAAAALAVASQWTVPSLAQDQRNIPKPPPQQQNKSEVPRPPRPDQHPQNHPPQNQPPQNQPRPNQYPQNQYPQNRQRPVENPAQRAPGQPPRPDQYPPSQQRTMENSVQRPPLRGRISDNTSADWKAGGPRGGAISAILRAGAQPAPWRPRLPVYLASLAGQSFLIRLA